VSGWVDECDWFYDLGIYSVDLVNDSLYEWNVKMFKLVALV